MSASLQSIAQSAWYWMDWVPVRLTALGFAFAGSFEEAVDQWRLHEVQSPQDNDGVVLAATAGAINIQLETISGSSNALPPQMAHLRSVVGLVWRTVVVWMVFLALVSLARLLG
jgi:adenosylcobinamide-phosphate synthase